MYTNLVFFSKFVYLQWRLKVLLLLQGYFRVLKSVFSSSSYSCCCLHLKFLLFSIKNKRLQLMLFTHILTSTQSKFVRGICITKRKIVSIIFKCNLIICLCSGKSRKNVQRQTPKDFTYILPKMEIVSHCF